MPYDVNRKHGIWVVQPAPARDFWPLESRHSYFPNANPYPNLQNNLENFLKSKKNNHSLGFEPAAYATQSERVTAKPQRQQTA